MRKNRFWSDVSRFRHSSMLPEAVSIDGSITSPHNRNRGLTFGFIVYRLRSEKIRIPAHDICYSINEDPWRSE